jgi:ssDNA-binding Zn-finger/Zn-ribbon topoisomerase 1
VSETKPQIDQFTAQEFEAALTEILNGTAWKNLGFLAGELCYAVPIKNTNKRLVIRSSIDHTGQAAATGEDSIRVWAEYWHEKARTWRPLGKDSKAWTTRLPGWQERLKDRLRKCWKVAQVDSKPKVESGAEICPECGAGMLLRTNRITEVPFWGCSNYPRCKGSMSVTSAPSAPSVAPETTKEFTWAHDQNDVFAFVETGEGHGVVEAVAGSGKTTTIVEALNHTDPTKTVGFVAFNKHIATELKRRAPAHVYVSTNHSLGFANIRAVEGKIKVDEDKLYRLLRDIEEALEPDEYYAVRSARPSLRKLVSLAKANMMEPLR